nr:hypothetical protein Iba_scaffold1357413CG0010 [Ipomoea batatas]
MASATLPTRNPGVTLPSPSASDSHRAATAWLMLPRHCEGSGGFNFFRKFTTFVSKCVFRFGFAGRIARITAAHMNADNAFTLDGREKGISGDLTRFPGLKIAEASTTRPPGLMGPPPRLIAAKVLNNPTIAPASARPCQTQNATAVPPHWNLLS